MYLKLKMGQGPKIVFTQLPQQRVKQRNRPALFVSSTGFLRKIYFQKILK